MKIKKFLSYVTAIAMLGSYAGAMPVSADSDYPSISIDTSDLDVEGNNLNWYYADETQWHSEGITVMVNGEVVENPELTYSYDGYEGVLPSELGAGSYEITATYVAEDGSEASAVFTAEIGVRGDANGDARMNVRDAALIANLLSGLYGSNETYTNDFCIFCGNVDNGIKENEHFGIYDLNVRDSAAIANSLARGYDISVVAEELAAVANAEPVENGQAISLSSVKGKPGETVTMELIAECNDNLESFDIVANFNEYFTAYQPQAANGCSAASDTGDGYFTVVGYGSTAISDGTVATVDITIPADMEMGEYPVEIVAVNTFAEFKGADCAEIVAVSDGMITVAPDIPESFDLSEGESIEFNDELTEFTVTSADESIAKVENNVLYGVSIGVTELTFTDAEGRNYTSKVVVQPAYYYEINAGEEKQLAFPEYTSELTWLSANTSAATVKDGLVKGVSAGETVIYAIDEAVGVIYEGDIVVNSDTPAVTTKPVEIKPSETLCIEEIGDIVEVEDYVDSEMPDHALYLAHLTAKPGETVSMPVRVKCNNNFEALDALIEWGDTSLTSSEAYITRASGASANGEGYCTVVAWTSAGISDGEIAYINFTVPADAVNGTVYNIDFTAINAFTEFENSNDYSDTVPTYGGSITVDSGMNVKESIEISVLDTYELTSEILDNFIVIPEDPTVVAVSGNVIKGVSQGTTKLYLIDDNGSVTIIEVIVTSNTPSAISMIEGDSSALDAFAEYTITSADDSIAKIEENVLYAVSSGITELTFTDKDGKEYIAKITVYPCDKYEIEVNEEKQIIIPDNNSELTWITSNHKVTTAVDGLIKGVAAGNAAVYAIDEAIDKLIYKGDITVTDGDTPAVTTKPAEINPSTTILAEDINDTVEVEDYVDSEMPDYALYLAHLTAEPGETVSMPVRVKCNNNFESLDSCVSYDTALDAYPAVPAGEAKGASNVYGDGTLSVVAYAPGGPIADGTIAYIDFTVPEDAVNGTVYDVYFSTVTGMWEYDVLEDIDYMVCNGSITVGGGIKLKETIEITALEAAELASILYDNFIVVPADSKVATANGNVIRGVSQGTTDLYLIDENGNVVKTELVVLPPDVPEYIEICEGETIDYSKDYDGYNIVSKDDTIASVKDNIISGVAIGTTELYFMDADGAQIAVTVRVTPPVNFEIAVGEEKDFSALSSAEGIKWLSENPEVATFSNGIVKGISAGEAVIYAVEFGQTIYKGTVTVTGETAVTTAVSTTATDSTDVTAVVTEVSAVTTEPAGALRGDANQDGNVNVRDCAFIAKALAKGESDTLPELADFNEDEKINVRDAAAIAKWLAGSYAD